ncbi:MAG: hypothetical protein NVS9B2_14470 [Steroidobacteraceae bacterium]
MSREHRIRELAYQLWLERGSPRGAADTDWLEAERRIAAAEPTPAASSNGVDDALRDTYPASDPPSSHLPDEPPANAEAKWQAAAASENLMGRASSQGRQSDPKRKISPTRKPQLRQSDQTRATDRLGESADREQQQMTPRTRPPAQ